MDPACWNNEPIQLASENGRSEVVKILLRDWGVDPSATDDLSLRWASVNGHAEVVKLLLGDPRVDPSSRANEAIKQVQEPAY